jgi:hypothetical protein
MLFAHLVATGNFHHEGSNTHSNAFAERLLVFSLALGLLVLSSLVVKQGCVPNAKPMLDCSACAPGLFGGQLLKAKIMPYYLISSAK